MGGGFRGSSVVAGGDYFYIISGIRGPRMPRRRGSWLSTVPWVRGGEEAAWGLGMEALLGCGFVPVSYVPKPGEEERMLGTRLKPLTFFIQGVFMVTILLVRAKPRYTGHINFWSMYNMQRFHLFPFLFQTRPKSLLSI
jgi:hypothetical protein